MTAFMLDASCMVAAVLEWHEKHGVTRREVETRLARGERLVSAAHALLETYSVLTRLPPPHRLAAEDARTLIWRNFIEGVRLVPPDARIYRSLLRDAPDRGVVGGRAYDDLLARCAAKAKVTALLTLDERHFHDLVGRGLALVVPGSG